VVPWDGYLKYYNLGEKHPGLIEKRRKVRQQCHTLRGFITCCAPYPDQELEPAAITNSRMIVT
jgi:hypothetical protein